MHLLNPYLSLLSLPTLLLTSATPLSHLIYQSPPGTSYENLAFQPSTNTLLLTTTTSPTLYHLNPLAPHPSPIPIAHFPTPLFTVGITQSHNIPDTFYLIAANATLNLTFIYTLSFPHQNHTTIPTIKKTASLPTAGILNGLAALTPRTLLASDSRRGCIWAIDILTGASHIALSDPLMAAPGVIANGPYSVLGINGIRIRGEEVFFTNSAQAVFARVGVSSLALEESSASRNASGPAVQVIAHASPGGTYDDFALAPGGDAAFLVDPLGDSVEEVRWGEGRGGLARGFVVAGNRNSTELEGPTSAQFGSGGVLYVTTAGGLGAPGDGDVVVGGQVVAVDTGGWSWRG